MDTCMHMRLRPAGYLQNNDVPLTCPVLCCANVLRHSVLGRLVGLASTVLGLQGGREHGQHTRVSYIFKGGLKVLRTRRSRQLGLQELGGLPKYQSEGREGIGASHQRLPRGLDAQFQLPRALHPKKYTSDTQTSRNTAMYAAGTVEA